MLSMTCKRDIFWQPDQCKDKNTQGAGDNVQNEPCGPMLGREGADDAEGTMQVNCTPALYARRRVWSAISTAVLGGN